MMKCLNLGCGEEIKMSTKNKKWINLDIVKLQGVNVIHDLNKFPYPFKNNEFEEVYTSHVIEHLDNLEKVMREIKRICKPKAKIIIRVPHFSCGVNYRDPTHKRLFSYSTFDYFTDECFYNLPKFRIIIKKLNFTRQSFKSLNKIINPIININPEIYERFFCWIIPASECLFVLEVIK